MENEITNIPKVRIGTDIRISINLGSLNDIVPETLDSVRAILINTTELEKKKKKLHNDTRYISRYPIEPMFEGFTSTKYNMHASGYPTYRVMPGSYTPAPYHGIGLNPNWCEIYKPCKPFDTDKYYAQIKVERAIGSSDMIIVYFPAYAQLFPGKFKLVLVMKFTEPGFIGNQRTITYDIPDIFELVTSSAEADNYDGRINIGEPSPFVTDNYLHDVVYGQDGKVVYSLLDGTDLPFTEWWEE